VALTCAGSGQGQARVLAASRAGYRAFTSLMRSMDLSAAGCDLDWAPRCARNQTSQATLAHARAIQGLAAGCSRIWRQIRGITRSEVFDLAMVISDGFAVRSHVSVRRDSWPLRRRLGDTLSIDGRCCEAAAVCTSEA
jgi:hypothetical protein